MARTSIDGRCSGIVTVLAYSLIATAIAAGRAQAVGIDPDNEFTLSFAPSARLLDAWLTDEYEEVHHEETCDNPHLRVRARNAPAVRIDNTSTTGSPLLSLTLEINEGPFVFGAGDGDNPGFVGNIKPTIYSDELTITGSELLDNGKKIKIDFSGFGAGEKALFYIDIDVDANDDAGDGAFPFPDYRNVLFGAVTQSGGTPTDPASYAATFGAPDGRTYSGTLVNACDAEGAAVDPAVFSRFQNARIRPYAAMDPMEIVSVGIPEPSSAALALAGLGALLARRRSTRKA